MLSIAAVPALWNLPLHTLLEASGVGAFVLAAGGWQMRSIMQKRRARRRPTAAVVSDAIMVGSNSPRPAAPKARADAVRQPALRQMAPVVNGLEKLSDGQWGFSLGDAGHVIVTFVYPGRDQAQAALKAMRRTVKDLLFALRPADPLAGEPEAESPMSWRADRAEPHTHAQPHANMWASTHWPN